MWQQIYRSTDNIDIPILSGLLLSLYIFFLLLHLLWFFTPIFVSFFHVNHFCCLASSPPPPLIEPRIAVGKTGTSSEHVTQHVLILPSLQAKKQWIIEMFPILASLGRTIIFVASRADCEDLATAIRNSSTSSSSAIVDTIHGDKDQRDRNNALLALKKGKVSALIATDVAARGLDVRDIRTVVNFDVAKNIDSHVHRVGRAGRMINTKKKKKEKENAPGDAVETTGDGTSGGGEYQKGDAYTLLTPKNADFANLLLESFEKEGREVSQELAALAMKSKRWGGGRSRRSKSGLGFHDEDHHHGGGGGGGGVLIYKRKRLWMVGRVIR
mmetsp:Transcript_39982/g.60474  ORF Transcript_39982/g.60474 Transcript_39982/m.60474 type:complete len:327 (-) Transcript_39982:1163-2143(-)